MSKKRTFAWLTTLVMIGTAFAAVIILLLRFVNGPVSSTVTLKDVKAAASPTPKGPNMLAGLTFELSYPGVFDQLAQVKNDPLSTEQYNIGSRAEYRRSIAVAVRALPSSSLSDDSNYRWRQINPSLYTESSTVIAGEPARIMTKVDKTEQTLFMAHKGKVLTVAVQSTQPKDDVAAFMAVILPTVRWRQ